MYKFIQFLNELEGRKEFFFFFGHIRISLKPKFKYKTSPFKLKTVN